MFVDLTVITASSVWPEIPVGHSWFLLNIIHAMAAMIGHWQLRRYGSYALEEKSSHQVIGVAGLDYPNDWPEPEIKWGLIREFWGRGYASEAVRAIKKMWVEYLPELSLISLIHPENANSINLAKAVGAYFEREHEFRGDTWVHLPAYASSNHRLKEESGRWSAIQSICSPS